MLVSVFDFARGILAAKRAAADISSRDAATCPRMTREALTALKRIDLADLIECVAAILSLLLLLPPPSALAPRSLRASPATRSVVARFKCIASI